MPIVNNEAEAKKRVKETTEKRRVKRRKKVRFIGVSEEEKKREEKRRREAEAKRRREAEAKRRREEEEKARKEREFFQLINKFEQQHPSIKDLKLKDPGLYVLLLVVLSENPEISKKPEQQIINSVNVLSADCYEFFKSDDPELVKELASIDANLPKTVASLIFAKEFVGLKEGVKLALEIDLNAVINAVLKLNSEGVIKIDASKLGEVVEILRKTVEQPKKLLAVENKTNVNLDVAMQISSAPNIGDVVNNEEEKIGRKITTTETKEKVGKLLQQHLVLGMAEGFSFYSNSIRNDLLQYLINTPAVKALLTFDERNTIVNALNTKEGREKVRQQRTDLFDKKINNSSGEMKKNLEALAAKRTKKSQQPSQESFWQRASRSGTGSRRNIFIGGSRASQVFYRGLDKALNRLSRWNREEEIVIEKN